MTIRREFLGLARPPLQLAADFLLERYTRGRAADLSQATVVLPGSRAARRLLEILVERAEQRAFEFTPPQIETVGHLPEQLYAPQKPFAADLVQQLAWVEVLRTATPRQLAPILTAPPAADDRRAWLDLGQLLARQHTELAADGLNFADVAERGREVEGFGEDARWEALRQIQTAYLRLLDELSLWDVQTARLVAVQRRECATNRETILVGAADISVTLRQMLDQLADRVIALVFAPEEWAERFDHYGCLVPAAWENAPIPIATDQVHVVDGPAEQADMAARCLAAYHGRYRPDEITMGLADEKLTPHLQRQLQQCQLASRSAAGVAMAHTPPYRLLAAIVEYLQREAPAEFAALVRHPDVYEWIEAQGLDKGWLEQLDAYFAEHLQPALGEQWLGEVGQHRLCGKVHRQVLEWLEPLRGPAKPLGDWSQPIRELLLAVYARRVWNRDDSRDRAHLRTFEAINEILEAHSPGQVPPRLMPDVTAAEALRLALQQLQSAQIAAPVDPEAIELLGWLELPWDDAPALVVTTFNEGHVPSSINSDLFLPNALRSHLGLQDNVRRYARDAYALSLLLATRARVDLIVARRNGDGEPLAPSRLLFAADAESIAQRVLTFFQPPQSRDKLPPLMGRLAAGREPTGWPVPRPTPLAQPLTELRVTAFRDYLACPYRFYLRHILHLQAVGDAPEELDGAAFGALLHTILKEFGEGPCREATVPREIWESLDSSLNRLVSEQFGRRPLASVGVQVEQLRARLSAFADKQAEWASQGWRIEHTEVPTSARHSTSNAGSPSDPADAPSAGRASLLVDDRPFYLRGRIDRIDVHRETGEHFIFDYKSSDSAKSPQQVHQRSGAWVDLQLPLYRHLAATLGITGSVKLGYVLLPKDTGKVQFCDAEWTADELAAADDVARDVVRKVRAEKFWPPVQPPPDFSEDFSAICQDSVFERDACEGV